MIKIAQYLAQAGFSFGIFTPEEQAFISSIIDDILSLVMALAIASVAIVGPMLLRSVQKKLETSHHAIQWELLSTIATFAVKSAQQTIDPENKTLKFDYAYKIVEDIAKKNGIKFINEEIGRVLIEAAVHTIKKDTPST